MRSSWALLLMLVGLAAAQGTVPVDIKTFITGLNPGQGLQQTTAPQGPLQLYSNQPFPLAMEVLPAGNPGNAFQPSPAGQAICSYFDKLGNYYFAVQGISSLTALTPPNAWYIIGAAPWGGSCPSLQLKYCMPCPVGSYTTDAHGCLPSPGGILFADTTHFPVGFEVGVGCQFQPAVGSPWQGANQLTWSATVIPQPPSPSNTTTTATNPTKMSTTGTTGMPAPVPGPSASPVTNGEPISINKNAPAAAPVLAKAAPAPAPGNHTQAFSRSKMF